MGMSIFADRPVRALLVIDVQRGVVGGDYGFGSVHNRDGVVANIRTLVDGARSKGIPVIWVQHNDPEMPIGSEYWRLAPELSPLPDEPIVHKRFRNSFEATDLEALLAEQQVGSLIICGAETNNCVRHTLHSALDRGYDVTLVADAHSAWDGAGELGPIPARAIIDEQNRSCTDYQLPGRRCDLTTTAEAF